MEQSTGINETHAQGHNQLTTNATQSISNMTDQNEVNVIS